MKDPADFLSFLEEEAHPQAAPFVPKGAVKLDSFFEYHEEQQIVVKPCPVPTVLVTDRSLATFHPLGEEVNVAGVQAKLGHQLLANGPFSLVDLPSANIPGNGVYALYYHGDFPLYEKVCSPGALCPIYVGKSAQSGRTTGDKKTGSRNLQTRLTMEHLKSIGQTDLGPENFTYRFIILRDEWVDLAEYSLIELFQPLWNTVVRGFGSRHYHKDYSRKPIDSHWDTLHPGRLGAGARKRSFDDTVAEIAPQMDGVVQAYQDAMALLGLPGGMR